MSFAPIITSMAHFLCQIPFLYLDCIFSQFVFGFFIFGKKFDDVHIHQMVRFFFLRFTEFVSSCAFRKDVFEWHHGYYK